MIQIKRCIYSCALSFIIGVSVFADNTLNKIYYHQASPINSTKEISAGIELCSIVFYFDQKPIINVLPDQVTLNKNLHNAKLVFFLPKTYVQNDHCRNMIDRLHKESSSTYQVYIAEEKKPISGIKIVITYNSHAVGFAYDQFESIGLQKGLVFRFYNKKLLNQLNKNESMLLRTAHLKKKDHSSLLIVDMAVMTMERRGILI